MQYKVTFLEICGFRKKLIFFDVGDWYCVKCHQLRKGRNFIQTHIHTHFFGREIFFAAFIYFGLFFPLHFWIKHTFFSYYTWFILNIWADKNKKMKNIGIINLTTHLKKNKVLLMDNNIQQRAETGWFVQ